MREKNDTVLTVSESKMYKLEWGTYITANRQYEEMGWKLTNTLNVKGFFENAKRLTDLVAFSHIIRTDTIL